LLISLPCFGVSALLYCTALSFPKYVVVFIRIYSCRYCSAATSP
jgi:hypothetical protein